MNCKTLFLGILLLASTVSLLGQSTFQKINQMYSDYSGFSIQTSAGELTVENVTNDGSEWAVKGTKNYVIERVLHDEVSEWEVAEADGSSSVVIRTGGDFFDWETEGASRPFNVESATYEYYYEWITSGKEEGNWLMKTAAYEDVSEWEIEDKLTGVDDKVKIALVFGPFISATLKPNADDDGFDEEESDDDDDDSDEEDDDDYEE